eukprot:5409610-Pleurochrysis_carterae.AAC.2
MDQEMTALCPLRTASVRYVPPLSATYRLCPLRTASARSIPPSARFVPLRAVSGLAGRYHRDTAERRISGKMNLNVSKDPWHARLPSLALSLLFLPSLSLSPPLSVLLPFLSREHSAA